MNIGTTRFLRRTALLLSLVMLLTLFCACAGSGDVETLAPSELTLPEKENGGKEWYTADPSGFRFTQEKVCAKDVPASSYRDFFASAAPTACVLPALPQNFVPQGMDYWDEEDWFIISGYFNPTTYFASSVLFAVDARTGEYVGEWELLEEDGTPHTGHDGGVAVTDKNIYLSTAYKLFRISLDDLRATGGSGKLQFAQTVKVPVKASFCNASGGYVFVGEFSIHGDKNYDIKGHEFGSNYAWSVAYKIDDSERGISENPEFILSIPEKIQGFSMLDDGRVFMTRSYGRTSNSAVYITKTAPVDGSPDGTAEVNGVSVPLYDTGSYESITVMPMAEGCTCRGNRAYMIFESAAYYYRAASSSVSKNPTDMIWGFIIK